MHLKDAGYTKGKKGLSSFLRKKNIEMELLSRSASLEIEIGQLLKTHTNIEIVIEELLKKYIEASCL